MSSPSPSRFTIPTTFAYLTGFDHDSVPYQTFLAASMASSTCKWPSQKCPRRHRNKHLTCIVVNRVNALPVTGQKMTTRDIISLQMDKDQEGRWQCPVLTKPFSNQTKIEAIRQPGRTNEANVYSCFLSGCCCLWLPLSHSPFTHNTSIHRMNDTFGGCNTE
jgi:hypothetical protein